jgi:diaminopimelate epimerase
MHFAKGHGTGNDFVLLPDPDGRLDLSPQLVARLCDRHTGIGADGILRAVRLAAFPGPVAAVLSHPQQPGHPQPEWFMDYHNADGSIAEMCGNGVRVFARYLLEAGLAPGPELAIATRSGVRVVTDSGDGWLTAGMGPAQVVGTGSARIAGRAYDGLAISVGNPHLACLLTIPVSDLDLTRPPELDPALFPDGANVEVIRVTGDHHIEMRVYERGSGLTLSCGTGAVAAAVRAAAAAGEWPGAEPARPWTVDVPGGRLAVTPSPTASLLAGPAVIVAAGELDDAWLRDAPVPADHMPPAAATRSGIG